MENPRQKKVLVVEDDEALSEILRHFFQREGLSFDAALSGMEALGKLSVGDVDLLILDLILPGTGGLEIVRLLQNPDWKKVPVVVITGKVTDPETEKAIRQEPNVVEYLHKPLNYPSLMALARKILG